MLEIVVALLIRGRNNMIDKENVSLDLAVLKTTLDKIDKIKRRQAFKYYLRHPLRGLVALYRKFIMLFMPKKNLEILLRDEWKVEDEWNGEIDIAIDNVAEQPNNLDNKPKYARTAPAYKLADGSTAAGKLQQCYDIAYLMQEKGMIPAGEVAIKNQATILQTFTDKSLDAYEKTINKALDHINKAMPSRSLKKEGSEQ